MQTESIQSRKKLVKKCDDDEVKSIIEACINLNSFPLSTVEKKDLRLVKKLLLELIKVRRKSLAVQRKLIVNHAKSLQLALSFIFAKVAEQEFCNLLQSIDSENESDSDV